MVGFIPATAARDVTLDNPQDPRNRDIDLWNYLSARPVIPVNIASGAASGLILGKQCILAGWSLRETTGTADLQVEFIDGGTSGDPVVGEQTILAPLPGSVGLVDTQVTGSATGTTASINASLPGVAGQTTYVTGFEITGSGATSAITGIATLAGVITGTLSYAWGVPAGATVPATPLVVSFPVPIAASGLNQAITLTVPASGTGATQIACAIHGYQRLAGSTAGQSGQTATSDLGEPGVLCRGGLYLRVITGSVVGSAWVRV